MKATNTEGQAPAAVGGEPDLEWLPGDWDDLDVPQGWEPVAELCRRVGQRCEDVVDTIVVRILEEIPAYRSGVPVSLADLRASVKSNAIIMLRGTAERRGPTTQELEIRRELGVRRARQGLAVNALLQAFVVGYREIWDELLRESRSACSEVRELLLMAAATVWQWIHDITDAVGTAYHERVRRSAALTSVMRERLFDALLGGSHDEDEVRSLANSLGFDTQGQFRAVATTDGSSDSAIAENVNWQLDGLSGQHQAVRRGDALIILGQSGTPNQVVGALKEVLGGDVAIGMGAVRQGIHGAALSIGDAERALALALRSGGFADFERDWHAATVIASEHRLTDLLAPGLTYAQQHPELARTIRVYASARLSISETARILHLHTNTVAYRLGRWTELTTWDPRTYDGLLRSMSAIVLLGDAQ